MRSASHSLLASLRDAKNKPAVPSRNIMETPPGCAAQKRIFGITEIEGGFPHSEIRGSKVVRTSPRLIAAYHVLHRLSAPRHPPNTLKALDRSHYQRPTFLRISLSEKSATFRGYAIGRGLDGKSANFPQAPIRDGVDRKTICFEHIRECRGQATFTTGARPSSPFRPSERSDMFPLHDDRQHA
jgi:hypothetical protein